MLKYRKLLDEPVIEVSTKSCFRTVQPTVAIYRQTNKTVVLLFTTKEL